MRTIAIIVVLSMSFVQTASAVVPFSVFPDVQKSHPHEIAIHWLRSRGVIQGNPDGTFRPDTRINRAEFVRIVASPAVLQGERVGECIETHNSLSVDWIYFPDVQRNEWFAPYVCQAVVNKMVNGYPDGTFKPGNYISFVEAAKILVAQFGGTYAEQDPWFKPYVERLGELNGIPVDIDSFEQKITRGQMAEMLYRLMAPNNDKTSKTYEDLAQ